MPIHHHRGHNVVTVLKTSASITTVSPVVRLIGTAAVNARRDVLNDDADFAHSPARSIRVSTSTPNGGRRKLSE